MPSRRRAWGAAFVAALLIGPLVTVAAPAQAADTGVRINEVSSDPTDFVELVNTSDSPVDIAGWTVVDNDPTHVPVAIVSTSTVLAPGALYSFQMSAIGGPGLGKGDSVTVAAPDGTTIDSYAWPAGQHASPSHGRCEGVATLIPNTAATPGTANSCPAPSVILNEVSSDNPDLVELYNNGLVPADITGWTVVDNDPTHAPAVITTVPTVLAPGEYYTFTPDTLPGGFGLGSGDSVTIRDAGGALVDSFDWAFLAGHATPSYGACPNGTTTADLVKNTARTPGAPNACPLPAGVADIKVNEVSSDPTDWVELTNIGTLSVDVSGWKISDDAGLSDATHLQPIPAGTALAPGQHLAIDYTAAGFGKGDKVNLYLADSTLVDSTQWPTDTHASTWGRCADGTGAFKATPATKGATNTCVVAPPVSLDPNWDTIEINEIASLNADDEGNPGFGDAVELVNTGTQPVSIEGWYQTDSGAATGAAALTLADLKVWDGSAFQPASSWIIPAGGYVAFTSKKGLSGEGDGVKIYGPGADPATRQLVDAQSYGDGDAGVSDTYDSDSRAFAACPNGSNEFWRVTTNSFGQDNTASCASKSRRLTTSVILNEVSNVAQKAELLNAGPGAVDISGWELLNGSGAVVHTVAAGTTLAAGAFYVADGVGGLGSADSLTIRRSGDLASIVAHRWYEDGIASYSRCELFGSTSYVETPVATWGAPNACPSLTTEPWPGSSTVTLADEVNGFGDADGNGEGDVSGATFDPADPSILWAVQNKNTLHKLTQVDGVYTAVPGWEGGKKLLFANGAGAVDSEGVAVGPDGSIYVTSERDNTNSSVSYNKIERYDVSSATSATTLTAIDEWDVNDKVMTGTNLGLEGIAYVPDTFLVGSGWKVGGVAYKASDHPTSGLFVTAVEGTGDLHFFSLAEGAAPVEVKVESSGFPFSMDVAFDADRGALWTLCDDTCGGIYNLLTVVDGDVVVAHSYARPTGMPNLNNEGMAIAPRSTCVAGEQTVVWADDGDTGGYSLRAGTLACPPPAAVVDLSISQPPSISGEARVGRTLTAVAPAVSPAGAEVGYQWLAGGTPIPGATAPTLTLGPAQVGRAVSVVATASFDGRSVSARSAATARVARVTSTLSAVVDPGQVKVFPARGWRTATMTITATATGGVPVDGLVVVTVQGALPTAGIMRHGVLNLQVGPFLRTGTSRISVAYLGSTSVAPSQTSTSVVVVR